MDLVEHLLSLLCGLCIFCPNNPLFYVGGNKKREQREVKSSSTSIPFPYQAISRNTKQSFCKDVIWYIL